ncbi:hypothetical protein BU16DRAFT_563209 [Lophium mytilinum]|uniref:SprT-like domain-containing protein n=1 Tax=Lophium mytilinum TaxID=390894 RepID=A0A6A6QRC5_9PEZI|nr:hypothetical protein BU16DRAFT_563209 [Lophium mytilinum]
MELAEFVVYVKSQHDGSCERVDPNIKNGVHVFKAGKCSSSSTLHSAVDVYLTFPAFDVVPQLSAQSPDKADLAQSVIKYIERACDGYNLIPLQTNALTRWRVSKDGLTEQLKAENISNTVGVEGIQKVVKMFADLLFFGAWKEDYIKIEWVDGTDKQVWGWATEYTISLDPIAPHRELSSIAVAPKLLNFILHEVIHVFLHRFACAACGSTPHGKAWQPIAFKLEEVATDLLGFPVNLGRLTSLQGDLRNGRAELPCFHDVYLYEFECSLPMSGTVAQSIQRTGRGIAAQWFLRSTRTGGTFKATMLRRQRMVDRRFSQTQADLFSGKVTKKRK